MKNDVNKLNDSSSEEVVKNKISGKLYFASLYFITVGVLYLWGYWPTFGVNILEFLDFADILKVTAYPIAFAVLVVCIGGGLGNWLGEMQGRKMGKKIALDKDLKKLSEEELRDEIFRRKTSIKKITKTLLLFRIIYFIATFALCISAFADWKYAWLFLPMFLAMPAILWIGKHPYMTQVLKDDGLRRTVAFFIVAIPAYAYGNGKVAAANIVNGLNFRYVISDIAGYTGSVAGQDLRFVGHAGDYIFLYDAKKQATIFIKLDDDKAVSLRKFETEIDMAEVKRKWESAMSRVELLWK